MRPFNIGDMVFFKNNKNGRKCRAVVIEITAHHIMAGSCFFEPFTGKPKAGFKHLSKITAIRSPRPGGKEARDIVKISAQCYKAIKNKRFRHLVFWGMPRENATVSSIEFAKNTDVYDIYQEQKSTLKVKL